MGRLQRVLTASSINTKPSEQVKESQNGFPGCGSSAAAKLGRWIRCGNRRTLHDMAYAREALWGIISVKLARQITDHRHLTRRRIGNGIDKHAKHDCVMGLGVCLTRLAARVFMAQCHRTRLCRGTTRYNNIRGSRRWSRPHRSTGIPGNSPSFPAQ